VEHASLGVSENGDKVAFWVADSRDWEAGLEGRGLYAFQVSCPGDLVGGGGGPGNGPRRRGMASMRAVSESPGELHARPLGTCLSGIPH